MAQPTRRGSSDASPGRPDSQLPQAPIFPWSDLIPRPDRLRRSWGAWCAVVGGVVTLVLLFRPWASATGPDGYAKSNAFGRIQASTAYLGAWSQQQHGIARINGVWAILAATALVAMCVVALVSIGLRTELAARCTAICAVVAAVLVLITLVYINAKAPELKAMTARRTDMGGQIGSFMAWAFGNGSLVIPGIKRSSYSSAGLTPWGMVACVVSLISAVAVVVQWALDHPVGRIHLRWRSPIVAGRTSAEPKVADPPTSSDRPEAEGPSA